MNYKKIIKSQSLRFTILNLLNWIPDIVMLRIQYRIKMDRWPDLSHPTRFSEKLQLYKLNYRNPAIQQCVDKYEVRKYVESKGLGHILNELYGIYDAPEEINYDVLPGRFVIKSTSGGGGNNVIVVKDKSTCDFDKIRTTISSWYKDNSGQINAGREWAYSDLTKARIITEKYLEDVDPNMAGAPHNEGLTDYKFFCFNGQPYCVQVDSGRFDDHHQNFYDMHWKSLGVHCTYPEGIGVEKPHNFEGMIRIAEQLSSEFPFVRVDLYNVNGAIYFGELTFYPSSGYGRFHPDSFDNELGKQFTEY